MRDVFPCKNTLRPSVVHNLTKISSFDQKMWAKETNRFFFSINLSFFSFSSVFSLKRAGGIFPFLFRLLHYFLLFVFLFFYVQFEERRWMNITAFYVFQWVVFSTHSLQKRGKLTPNALKTGGLRAGLRAGILSAGLCHVTCQARRWTKAVAFWQ